MDGSSNPENLFDAFPYGIDTIVDPVKRSRSQACLSARGCSDEAAWITLRGMIPIISFFVFTGLVAVVAWLATRTEKLDTSTGYFLAGRHLGWAVIAGSLLLTNLSTEQLVGLNGNGYRHGMQVMSWETWSALAIILMALVFLPRFLTGGVTTVPQYLEVRFDRGTRVATSALFLVSMAVNFLPFVLYSGALALNELFGVPELLGVSNSQAILVSVISIAIVGASYAIFGGLKAVAVSDTINGIGLLLGGLMIPILGLMKVGDGSLLNGWQVLAETHPDKFNAIGAPGDNLPFPVHFTGLTFIVVFYWCTNQAIVQRTFAARSLVQGQKGVLLTAFLKLFGPFYLVLPGIIAFHLFGGALENPDNAYSMLVNETVPAPLIGFFGAVVFGAILSSFNSVLNSSTALFGLDIYKGWLKKDATDHQTVRAGKIFGTILAVVALTLAPMIANAPAGLFDLMKQINSFFNIPLLALVVMGMLTKHTTALAAKVGLVFGMLFYGVVAVGLENTLFGNEWHWLHVAGLNFWLIILVMTIVTKTNPRPTPYEHFHTKEVDIQPWKYANFVGGALAVLILLSYVYFSPLFFN